MSIDKLGVSMLSFQQLFGNSGVYTLINMFEFQTIEWIRILHLKLEFLTT